MAQTAYRLEIDPSLAPCPVLAALVWAEGIEPPRPTQAPPPFLVEILAEVAAHGEGFISDEQRRRVRGMLRHGKYQPSGRGRPASEFLLRAALAGTFPLVNGPVDVNNALSLASGLPGSIFDAGKTGPRLRLRRGASEESYVFNPSGQTIALRDLLVVCRLADGQWSPCGNPVKDAMATKVNEAARSIIAVLYAPAGEPLQAVAGWAARYAALLSTHCGARAVGSEVIHV